MLELIVPCAGGLEPLVRDELETLGAERCSEHGGSVRAAGTWETVWRANLGLRCGRRVLVGLADWEAFDEEALGGGLVDAVRRDPGLRRILAPDRTVAVHGSASRSRLQDGRLVGTIVRRALRDAQTQHFGRSSQVAPRAPDLPLRVRVYGDRATLLLDTSGRALDARGARPERRGDPRATVCAAVFAAAGWDGAGALCDPFAGDGRVLEEAVAAAEGWAPGRRRAAWPFEGFASWDAEAFSALASEPGVAPGPPVFAGDPRPRRARDLEEWGRELGLGRRLRTARTDPGALDAPAERGLLVCAPPPGGRPEDWKALGWSLKHRFQGWTASLLCTDGGERHLGLRPRRTLPVRDGDLAATIAVFDLWEGRR